MKVKVYRKSSWTTQRVREFDDDASSHYVENTGGGTRIAVDEVEAEDIVKYGNLDAYLSANADGDGDECGSSGTWVIMITDADGNLLFDGGSGESDFHEEEEVRKAWAEYHKLTGLLLGFPSEEKTVEKYKKIAEERESEMRKRVAREYERYLELCFEMIKKHL